MNIIAYALLLATTTAPKSSLYAGETLNIGDKLIQSDQSYITLKLDGNLQYVSSSRAVLWETGPTGGSSVSLESSGTLSIKDSNGTTKWQATGPSGPYLSFFAKNGVVVLDDGNNSVPVPTYGSKFSLKLQIF